MGLSLDVVDSFILYYIILFKKKKRKTKKITISCLISDVHSLHHVLYSRYYLLVLPRGLL